MSSNLALLQTIHDELTLVLAGKINRGGIEATLRDIEAALVFPQQPEEPVKPDNVLQSFWDKAMEGYKFVIQYNERKNNELLEAARAVIERWDSPLWKDLPSTSEYIARLQKAIENSTR